MSPQSKIQRYLVVASVVFILLLAAAPAFATEVRVDSKSQEIKIGEQFKASVFLDTEGEYINAIEGKLLFPDSLLELKEIQSGNTIINFWIEKPRTETVNQIIFSGITPGGYIGERGPIFSAIFQTKKAGRGTVEVRGMKALLNDGKGTDAHVTTSNLNFLISNQLPTPQIRIVKARDIDPPEPFEPEVARDSTVFEGKYFLVFATQDKGSGVDHYEVREAKSQFVIAESPYLLRNQDLHKEIAVKAVDKRGNERVVTLPPLRPLPWYRDYSILAMIIATGAVIVYASRKIIRGGL